MASGLAMGGSLESSRNSTTPVAPVVIALSVPGGGLMARPFGLLSLLLSASAAAGAPSATESSVEPDFLPANTALVAAPRSWPRDVPPLVEDAPAVAALCEAGGLMPLADFAVGSALALAAGGMVLRVDD